MRAKHKDDSGGARRETRLHRMDPATRRASPSCETPIRLEQNGRYYSSYRTTHLSRRLRLADPSETPARCVQSIPVTYYNKSPQSARTRQTSFSDTYWADGLATYTCAKPPSTNSSVPVM